MPVKLGKNAKMYRNTAVYATPTWVEVKNVMDLTYSRDKSEAEASTRGYGGYRARKGALKDLSLDFDMAYDEVDPDVVAIEDSYDNDTILDVLVLSGPLNVSGSRGIRADVECFKFEKSEDLEDIQKVSVALKPAYSTHPPTPFVVP